MVLAAPAGVRADVIVSIGFSAPTGVLDDGHGVVLFRHVV